ncbi:MAG TPA: hypothetical protein ENI06_04665 [Spirochaetales bacterium]|nr:hypothetical protein [Spirochaetales bacterium]
MKIKFSGTGFITQHLAAELIGLGCAVPLAVMFTLNMALELPASISAAAGTVIIFGLIINYIIARRKGQFIAAFYQQTLNNQEIESGFIKLVRLPLLQSLLIFLRMISGTVIIAIYIYYSLQITIKDLTIFLVSASFASYMTGLINYFILFYIIDQPLKDIINGNYIGNYISPELIENKKYFGLSSKSRILMFLFIPVTTGMINILLLSIFYPTTASFLSFKNHLLQLLLLNFFSFLLGFLMLFLGDIKRYKNLWAAVNGLTNTVRGLNSDAPSALEDEFAYLSYRINLSIKSLFALFVELKRAAASGSRLSREMETTTAKASDKLAAISASIDSFKERSTNLNQQISHSNNTFQEIKDFIQQVNRRIEDQAASVTQSSAAVEEIIASMNNMTKIAEAKKGLINNLTSLARIGESNMSEMAGAFKSIDRSAGTILEMMEIINTVSKETDLLAMNAAIEAAHAGEYGRGFAVVAEEIRKLSETTASNTANISSTLTGIIDNIKQTTKVTENTGSSISQIIEGITEVAQSMNEMILGMSEISSGNNEVMNSLSELVSITEDVKQYSGRMDSQVLAMDQVMEKVANLAEDTFSAMDNLSADLMSVPESIKRVSSIGTETLKVTALLRTKLSAFPSASEEGIKEKPELLKEKIE